MAGQFQLVMRTGPNPGTVFPLEGDQIMIGRDSTNGVAINDAEMSRRHARLTFQGGKYVIEDVGSTNGTFVNGQRLAGPYVLKPGDVVAFGEQIVLMYDAANMDPGATLATSRKPAPPMAAPVAAPVYSSPAAAPAPAPAAGRASPLPIALIVGIVLFLCACGGFFFWVDSTYRWCVFFPFLSGC